MREDMTKVLVEEPRKGRAMARCVQGTRRQQRNRLDPDGESAPTRIGMQRGGPACKSFGEHLGPLYRYLRQQVGRPWNKVYGELRSVLDRRSVVQDHLFQHIGDRVAIETKLVDGEVLVPIWGHLEPLGKIRHEMYVHPRTGILLVNRAREKAARRRKAEHAAEAQRPNAERRVDIPGLAPDRQWHRIDGYWFEVELRPLAGRERVYDAVLRRLVNEDNSVLLSRRYGFGDRYAASKRQLSRRTTAPHGLD